MTESQVIRHYFVDEAGDLTLFNKRGSSIVGQEGVSRVFMVGVAYLPHPEEANKLLTDLRTHLMKDPYFKDVPSMRPDAQKTALLFHAKNDLPEVRREMFTLLPKLNAEVQIAVRRKEELVSAARISQTQFGKKLSVSVIYDDLVKRLFKNLLHQADCNRIVFAKHSKWGRREALANAIAKAKHNFERKWNISSNRPTDLLSGTPEEYAGLQVIDYYLWALQRLYERKEDRFYELLAADYKLVMDLDDTTNKKYGEWYSKQNPLVLKKLKPPAS